MINSIIHRTKDSNSICSAVKYEKYEVDSETIELPARFLQDKTLVCHQGQIKHIQGGERLEVAPVAGGRIK